MKKILITGHLGFIGSELVKQIESSKSKYKVIGFDKKNGSHQDLGVMDNCVNLGKDVDVIIHLAGQTDVQDSVKFPLTDALQNIVVTVGLLHFNPKTKIIIASSLASVDPKSPYGISKNAIEKYAQTIHKNTVICRLPNIFGLDGKGVVTKFIDDEKIKIFGKGKQTRDFVHVSDVANAFKKAIRWKAGFYELGSGKSISINKLAKATGKKILYKKELKGEILESKAKNTTPNWKPKINVLEFIRDNY